MLVVYVSDSGFDVCVLYFAFLTYLKFNSVALHNVALVQCVFRFIMMLILRSYLLVKFAVCCLPFSIL